MNRWHVALLALVASLWVVSAAAPAAAATCTINGTVALEPLDGYYCDTTFGNNCSGWKVVDLDTARGAAAKRLPYMRLEVWQGSNYLGRLSPIAGCSGCPTGADGYCIPLYGALAGWRNNIQVMRFMWDLIDASTDGGWDSVDYTAGSLVTAMQSMPTGFGVDGSCRESERPPGQSCNPAVNGDPVSGGTGSRDAYNPRDISDLLPEDLTNVMDINCVGFATDN